MKHRWLLAGILAVSTVLAACAPGDEGGQTDAAAPASTPTQAGNPDDYGY